MSVVEPTPARGVVDSVVSAVLSKVVAHSVTSHSRHAVFIQDDSGLVSAASLPRLDSIDFVIVDSAGAQQLANERGDFTVLTVARPSVAGDTARSGFTSRGVMQQKRNRVGVMVDLTACAFRLRRENGRWQVDSTLGCVMT